MAKIAALKNVTQLYKNHKHSHHVSPLKKRRPSWVDVEDNGPPRKKMGNSARTPPYHSKKKTKQNGPSSSPNKSKSSPLHEPSQLRKASPYTSSLPAYSQLFDASGNRRIDYSTPLPIYEPRSSARSLSFDLDTAAGSIHSLDVDTGVVV